MLHLQVKDALLLIYLVQIVIRYILLTLIIIFWYQFCIKHLNNLNMHESTHKIEQN